MASATLTSPGGASRPMVLSGHSGPLKYASAQDVPSYPSPGLNPGGAAASAAAALGWASSAASTSSPREYQFDTPRSSDALLAAGWAQRQQPKQQASPPSLWVSTAANLAFRATKTPPPTSERPELFRQNSMHAAKGAMGARPRSRSSPQTATEKTADQFDNGGYALSAATIAHRPSIRANAFSTGEAGAVPYTTMDRLMFTSQPPVKPETDEKNRADVLHASALAMAKTMYDRQQKMIDNSARAHTRSSSFPGLGDSQNQEEAPAAHNNLQEAAYRLAQERLAKLQEEHDKQRNLQEYYGSGTPQRTRFGTIKGKLTRRRSSSDGDLLDDKRRSEQIRKQMSLLNSKLTEVDEEKRTRDREALLATAQRNVKAQMQQMDEKVQSDTGRVPQITMDDWGRKAMVAAQARSAASGPNNAGKVDIGGGKFMDKSEVEKIAAQNVQPLLDEINNRAEKEKARLEEERLVEERRKEKAETEKMREREIQEIHRKLKEQQKEDEKARRAEIKQEEKLRKDEAKAIKAEEKHAVEGKQKEALPVPEKTEVDKQDQPPPAVENKRMSTVGRVRTLSINFGKRHPRRKESVDKSISPDENSTSPTRKVRAWLLSRFPRPRARAISGAAAEDQESSDNSKKGFIGGVALARLQGNNSSTPSVTGTDKGRGKELETETLRPDSSMREVAMAGRSTDTKPQQQQPMTDEPGESSTAAAAAATAAITSPSTPPPRQTQTTKLQKKQRPISGASQVSEASIPASVASEQHSVSSMSNSSTTTTTSGDDRFVEARSEPETSGGSVGSSNLAPPRAVGGVVNGGGGAAGDGGGAVVVLTGRISPFRGSRFSEIL